MNHELKIKPEYYEKVINGTKKFELRRNDRDFKVGDIIRLREYLLKTSEYTGRYCYVEIITIWESLDGLLQDYCIMEIRQRI